MKFLNIAILAGITLASTAAMAETCQVRESNGVFSTEITYQRDDHGHIRNITVQGLVRGEAVGEAAQYELALTNDYQKGQTYLISLETGNGLKGVVDDFQGKRTLYINLVNAAQSATGMCER